MEMIYELKKSPLPEDKPLLEAAQAETGEPESFTGF
jgi:hypothetical protein